MNPDTLLRRAAAVLAVVVAGTHLYWALPEMARQLHYGQVPDPRPAVFLLATVGIFVGIMLVAQGFDPTPVYVGGILLMVTFIAGYVAWHTVLDHGAFWPGIRAHGHDADPVSVVLTHLRHDSLALTSKLAETALAGVLAVLLVRERSADAP
ncbi:hypothetical protein JCM17823_08370 [Halorubrum gandharaense]